MTVGGGVDAGGVAVRIGRAAPGHGRDAQRRCGRGDRKGHAADTREAPGAGRERVSGLTCAIERSLNVATPPTALTTVVPERVPGAGLPPSATVTVSVNPSRRLPTESCAATSTGGVMAAPPIVLLGWVVNASLAAGPAAMSNGALVAAVSLVASAFSV